MKKMDLSENCSEISLRRKKLKEAETQVKSLTLILEQARVGNAHGIDAVALEQSKAVLESRIMELKEYISKKELEIGQENDDKSRKYEVDTNDFFHSNETEDGPISRNQAVPEKEKELCLSSGETNALSLSVNEWMDVMDESGSSDKSESSLDDLAVSSEENNFIEYLRKENAKLRQRLSEARQRYKEERDNIIENLRVLELETVTSERNWESEANMQRLKIAKLVDQSRELKAENNELTTALKISETAGKESRIKEIKILKEKEEAISELKLKVENVEIEKEKLEDGLKGVQSKFDEAKATAEQLAEREVALKLELREKSETVEEKSKELEKCSEEIKEMRIEMEKLQVEVISLKEVKNGLEERLKTLKNSLEMEILRVTKEKDEKNLLQEKFDEKSQNMNDFHQTKVDLETQLEINKELKIKLSEAKDDVKCLEGHELQNKEEMTELKQKLLQKER